MTQTVRVINGTAPYQIRVQRGDAIDFILDPREEALVTIWSTSDPITITEFGPTDKPAE